MRTSNHPPLSPSPYGRLFRDGHPWIWGARCVTALLLLMVAGIVGIVLVKGLNTFWPRRLLRVELADGSVVVGEEVKRAVHKVGADSTPQEEIQFRVGNRELGGGGGDFRWIAAKDVVKSSEPEDLLSFDRFEYGPAYGRVSELIEVEGEGAARVPKVVAKGADALPALRERIRAAKSRREARLKLQMGEGDRLSGEIETLRIRRARAVTTLEPDDPVLATRVADLDQRTSRLAEEA